MKVVDEVRLYEIMQKELLLRIRDFEEVKQSLMHLKRESIDSEIYTKKFEEQIEMLDKYRRYIKLKGTSTDVSSDTKVGAEELKNLLNVTQAVIDGFTNTLKLLAPIKNDVEKIKRRAYEGLDHGESFETLYRHSRMCLNVIDDVSYKVGKNLEKGTLHDIVMANSLIKADIQLLNKTTEKR